MTHRASLETESTGPDHSRPAEVNDWASPTNHATTTSTGTMSIGSSTAMPLGTAWITEAIVVLSRRSVHGHGAGGAAWCVRVSWPG